MLSYFVKEIILCRSNIKYIVERIFVLASVLRGWIPNPKNVRFLWENLQGGEQDYDYFLTRTVKISSGGRLSGNGRNLTVTRTYHN